MILMLLSAATTVQTRFDASTLHDCPQVAMETGMVDDGSGNKMVIDSVCLSSLSESMSSMLRQ